MCLLLYEAPNRELALEATRRAGLGIGARRRGDRGALVRLRTLLAAACAAGLVAAPAAAADSLVFIRDSNVWLSNPDGSGQYQVTLDGTAGSPYESASQSSDGTILAIRQPPGGRNQFWRMTQSGRLLNTPINTPAARSRGRARREDLAGREARGLLVRYDGERSVLPVLRERVEPGAAQLFGSLHEPRRGGHAQHRRVAVLGHERHDHRSGVAVPHSGTTGSGMPEAAEWFTLGDLTGEILSLLDAEAAPTGDRVAGCAATTRRRSCSRRCTASRPTSRPSPASRATCSQGPPGSSRIRPGRATEGCSSGRRTTGSGSGQSPPPGDCGGYGATALRIPGAKTPDLSPAAINPDARPPCGNPGNPTACGGGCMACTPPADVKKKLTALLAAEAKALRRLGIRKLLRRKRTKLAFEADGPGTLALRLTGSRTAEPRHPDRARHAQIRRCRQGPRRPQTHTRGRPARRRAAGVRASLRATFTPSTGSPTAVSRRIRLR